MRNLSALRMIWEEPFRFEDDLAPDPNRIHVPIDLENVIIEGSRRIKEIEELNQQHGAALPRKSKREV